MEEQERATFCYGKLLDVFIPWNRHLNRSRGFAFIRFFYEQEAFNAIQCLHRRRIDGRVVHIDWAKGQPRRGTIEPGTSQPQHQATIQASDRSFAATVRAPKVGANIQTTGSSRFTTIADSRAVENRLRMLNLALVGTAIDSNV
ncbi:organelle RRM domain-containing protein 6, chloroplastic-like [Magnolia sinica]|uniref:organelle RRM domain-containing protein 6, chloroplastic-like n=1 Tax=Magnolia sinica TaxID=86752 RepID=UPI002658FCF1|nr:organelle RRM domain-containing protein 6, chloroplastic-like [Magnolia sinica]